MEVTKVHLREEAPGRRVDRPRSTTAVRNEAPQEDIAMRERQARRRPWTQTQERRLELEASLNR